MNAARTKADVLEQQYLAMRAKILEIAAGLDRLDRAEGAWPDDGRRQELEQGVRLLLDEQPHRAKQVQLLFSREYDESWRRQMGV